MAYNLGQPLKYPGGKNYLARKIVDLMPPHRTYCEPYFGGGAVLLARDPRDARFWLPPHKGVSEVVNDLNGALIDFWRVLQDRAFFADFHRLVEATPFSGVDFHQAQRMVRDGHEDPVRRAWAFFVANRQSLAGRMDSFAAITQTRLRAGKNEQVSAWLHAVAGLPEVYLRLRDVLILPPQPALEVIRKFDFPATVFYCDPPYLHETRETVGEYAHEMSDADHRDLLDVLVRCQAQVMLSGYRSRMYDETLKAWHRHEFPTANHASHARTKETKVEVVWCNFPRKNPAPPQDGPPRKFCLLED